MISIYFNFYLLGIILSIYADRKKYNPEHPFPFRIVKLWLLWPLRLVYYALKLILFVLP